MFSKKESAESGNDSVRNEAPARPAPSAPRSGGPVATIGPSIRIDGDLQGDEDLVVEGKVTGTVQLKSHTLTIGSQGQVKARVYAHTILVEGTVDGDLYASERISIRQSARIEGNIYAPRISLEDGARFRGTIDMETDNEAFRKAFGNPRAASAAGNGPSPAGARDGKPTATGASNPGSSSNAA